MESAPQSQQVYQQIADDDSWKTPDKKVSTHQRGNSIGIRRSYKTNIIYQIIRKKGMKFQKYYKGKDQR